ncbi:MAG TPA: DoxX family protein [Pseudacidobacterium sp.]|jgi:putative oxidoreductase|nr:DoxX family protein [Pseudacidobacterium sp.]
MKKICATKNDFTITIVRLVLGIIYFIHGAQLGLGWFGGYGFRGTMHFFTTQLGIPAYLAALAILAQLLGGLGLIVGFLGRIAALGIAVTMAVAIYKVHLPNGFFMNWSGMQKGEGYEFHLLALALCFLIMVKGSGALSVDRLIAKS